MNALTPDTCVSEMQKALTFSHAQKAYVNHIVGIVSKVSGSTLHLLDDPTKSSYIFTRKVETAVGNIIAIRAGDRKDQTLRRSIKEIIEVETVNSTCSFIE